LTWLRDSLAYLWGGWAAVAGLALLAALWQAGHDSYGSFILPSPLETLAALARLTGDGRAVPAAMVTGLRALAGFVLSAGIGAVIGIAVGRSPAALRATRPVVTVLMGVPPIAWIVLALLWFGSGGKAAVVTVVVTAFPIAFAGAVEGARTLDRGLEDMAHTFSTPLVMRLWDVHLPHVLSYLFPAWVTALGTAWKVTVMAELLGAADGIGAGLAVARVNLDTAEAMAWTLAVVGTLLAVEYLILHPLQRRMEPWRAASAPPSGAP
jgi:NitT/TauT family transport system permease protein